MHPMSNPRAASTPVSVTPMNGIVDIALDNLLVDGHFPRSAIVACLDDAALTAVPQHSESSLALRLLALRLQVLRLQALQLALRLALRPL